MFAMCEGTYHPRSHGDLVLRQFLQFGVTLVSLAMVGAGLYLSMGPTGEGILLDRPGTPGRLVNSDTSATAFFELDGDALELTMLFSEPDDPDSVFKTRVRLKDGQSHSIVVGEDEAGARRYTFRRIGYTVEMRSAPAMPLAATLRLDD